MTRLTPILILAAFIPITAAGRQISLDVVYPHEGAVYAGPTLSVRVDLTSDYALKSVVASLDDRSDSLTGTGGALEGSILLTGLGTGNKVLVVTATDVFDHQAVDSVHFRYSTAPALTIVSAPEQGTRVGTPTVDIIVAASGLAKPIRISGVLGSTTLYPANDTLRTTVNVAQYQGSEVTLSLFAYDTLGVAANVNVPFYVDTTSTLHDAVTMPEGILGFNGRWIVSGDTDTLHACDLLTQSMYTIGLPAPYNIASATATATGFIAVTRNTGNSDYRAFEWTPSALTTLVEMNGLDYADISVTDTFVVWGTRGGSFVRKNLLTGDSVTFSGGGAGNTTQSLAPNGHYAFWGSDYNIYYFDDSLKQITFDGSDTAKNVYPSTDGSLVVFRHVRQYPQPTSLELFDGHTCGDLESNADASAPPLDYLAAYGYVAFAKRSAFGERNLYLRLHDGSVRQLTYFGNTHYPYIESITPSASVLFGDGTRSYLADSAGTVGNMSSSLARLAFIGNHWYGSIGRTFMSCDGATPVGVSPVESPIPSGFALAQNYPNPFNPATTIAFTLPTPAFVSMKIFDVLGREVETLVSAPLAAGTHAAHWDASRFASGVYFCRLDAGAFAATRKLLLLK